MRKLTTLLLLVALSLVLRGQVLQPSYMGPEYDQSKLNHTIREIYDNLGVTGLTGPTGPKGDIGLVGATGATGTTGATGPAGADGTDGLDGADGEGVPPGMVLPYCGTSLPTGYLTCDGSAVSRTTYATLFSKISTTWGVGDGSTTFNLPNFLGRGLIGDGTGSGLTARTVADTGGTETHTLVESEMPGHTHSVLDGSSNPIAANDTGSDVNAEYRTGFNIVSVATGDTFSATSTGGDGAHNNMHPFAVIKWCIKY